VKQGIYPNRSEAIRIALRDFLNEEMPRMEKDKKKKLDELNSLVWTPGTIDVPGTHRLEGHYYCNNCDELVGFPWQPQTQTIAVGIKIEDGQTEYLQRVDHCPKCGQKFQPGVWSWNKERVESAIKERKQG
jgi:hypothetical protein